MSFSSFVRSTTLDGIERVAINGIAPLDTFDDLQAAIVPAGGTTLGNLFCEPLISHGNGAAETTISWYAAYEGEAVALTALDPGARSAAEALLKARIDALQPVIASSPNGPMIAAALYMPDPADVFVIGGEPVLTNWGLAPEGAQDSPLRSTAAFAAGIGALGVAMTAPPLEPEGFDAWRQKLPGAGAATGATQNASARATKPPAAPGAAPPPPPPSAAPVVAGTVPWYRTAWAPALLSVIVAAVLLILLMIPGVLIAPEQPQIALIEEETRLLDESNRALEERLARLREAQDTGICTAEGNFLSEPGSPGPLTPPGAADPGETEEGSVTPPASDQDTAEAPPAPLLAPPLQDIAAPDDGTLADTNSLLDFLDETVVLVLTPSAQGFGVGTGFFVNTSQIVTNAHVVNQGEPDSIYVINKRLGQAVPVEVVAQTASSEPGTADFALLTGEFAQDQPFMSVSADLDRLDHVIAAGYPLITTADGERFQRLVQGDDSGEPPVMSTTRGVVTAVQSRSSGVEVIAHDADISPGNSGGPLVDLCGRAVGVNSFTSRNSETHATARFSLHSRSLRSFLEGHGVATTDDDSPCSPAATGRTARLPEQAPAPAPAQNAPAEPATPAQAPATESEPPQAAPEQAPDPVERSAPEPESPSSEPEQPPEEEARASQAPTGQRPRGAPPPSLPSGPAEGLPEGVFADESLAPE